MIFQISKKTKINGIALNTLFFFCSLAAMDTAEQRKTCMLPLVSAITRGGKVSANCVDMSDEKVQIIFKAEPRMLRHGVRLAMSYSSMQPGEFLPVGTLKPNSEFSIVCPRAQIQFVALKRFPGDRNMRTVIGFNTVALDKYQDASLTVYVIDHLDHTVDLIPRYFLSNMPYFVR
jgi:hypothetical protein